MLPVQLLQENGCAGLPCFTEAGRVRLYPPPWPCDFTSDMSLSPELFLGVSCLYLACLGRVPTTQPPSQAIQPPGLTGEELLPPKKVTRYQVATKTQVAEKSGSSGKYRLMSSVALFSMAGSVASR